VRIPCSIRFLIPAVALFSVMGTQASAQSVRTHHVPQAVASGQARLVSALPATQSLRLDIVLPLSDPDGLDTFVKDVADPTSSSYRRFLSVSEFTARFGPTQADYDAAVQYATSNGLTVYGGSRDGMDVQVEGSVENIERAFRVKMGVYQHPTENRTFYGPDQEPTAGLPFALWHISGLDNYSIPHPKVVKRSDYAKSKGIDPKTVVSHATTGSGPSASFLGSDMRAAYYGGALTGAGQNLGLLEYYGTDLTDLNTYFSNIGQTNSVPITLLSTDGTSTSCLSPKCDDTEQTLDMTQALGMAPGLASLVMYIGSSDTAIISAMTTHNPLPTTIGCSWGWTPADPSTLNPYFEKMAAQGQNFFVASGDSSTWSSKNEAWPADNAYVVAVGGTDLSTTGPNGSWLSETAWSDSGGGISPDKIAIPSWQQLSGVINSSNKGSTTYRNGPDVSANANFTYYVCADQTTCTANEYGGTSFAAPLWAAYMALVNEQAAANSSPTLGFINPAVYSFGVGSGYAADFHDITSGTSGSYSAVAGYDLVTGWGSPNAGLLNALLALPASPNFTLSASPTSVSVMQGSNGPSTVSTTVSGGFSSAIALSASGLPTGVTVAFSPTSIASPGAGTSTVTITVASTAAVGTHTITITGTGGGTTHTATVSLTVTASSANFTISASPTSLTVAKGSSGTTTITTALSGGFNSAIALSATGEPFGVNVAFTPTSIAAPGSGTSTMKITVSSNGFVSTGTHTITIKGTGGSKTNTTTLSLTIVQ
jgi:subtilase family serine protease